MHGQIFLAVKEAIKGSRKVKITFKKEATFDLNYLLGMNGRGTISIDKNSTLTLMSIAQFGDWESDNNRTIMVTLTEKFDQSWFIGRMSPALEKIEAIN